METKQEMKYTLFGNTYKWIMPDQITLMGLCEED